MFLQDWENLYVLIQLGREKFNGGSRRAAAIRHFGEDRLLRLDEGLAVKLEVIYVAETIWHHAYGEKEPDALASDCPVPILALTKRGVGDAHLSLQLQYSAPIQIGQDEIQSRSVGDTIYS